MKKPKLETIAAPLSAASNKTGAWRTSRPKTVYDKCIGCSLCAKLCPEACIAMQPDAEGRLKPFTDLDYCKGCALCAKECPVKAILMEADF